MAIKTFEQFQGEVKKHGGKAKKFEQNWYLSRMPFNAQIQDGACRALSAAFLIRNVTRSIEKFEFSFEDADEGLDSWEVAQKFGGKKFFEAFQSDGGAPDAGETKRFGKIESAQVRSNAKTATMDGATHEKNVTRAMKMLSNGYMAKLGGRRAYMVQNLDSYDWLWKCDLPAYWYISCDRPGESHAMAIVMRNGILSNKYKLFDSNRGAASFEDAFSLQNFTKAYLSTQSYNSGYFLRFKWSGKT